MVFVHDKYIDRVNVKPVSQFVFPRLVIYFLAIIAVGLVLYVSIDIVSTGMYIRAGIEKSTSTKIFAEYI